MAAHPVAAIERSTAVVHVRTDSNKPKYVASFDGIRFIAFLAVLFSHCLNWEQQKTWWGGLGGLGVKVFFVLSGFLIGGILLDQRDREGITLKAKITTFYIRRSLRIFPLYYFIVLLTIVMPLVGIRMFGDTTLSGWLATYTYNFKVALYGSQFDPPSHFWSLSIEEQFYLFAPIILLTCPIRTLMKGCVVLWLGILAARVYLSATGLHQFGYLSPLQFLEISLGVAAAVLVRNGMLFDRPQAVWEKWSRWAGFAALVLFTLGRFDIGSIRNLTGNLFVLGLAVWTCGVLVRLRNGELPTANRVLSQTGLVYLGKISYGLYVYHVFVLAILRKWIHSAPMLFVVGLGATVLVASISWFLFEAPILRLKDRFEYRSSIETTAASAPFTQS